MTYLMNFFCQEDIIKKVLKHISGPEKQRRCFRISNKWFAKLIKLQYLIGITTLYIYRQNYV